MRYKQKIQMRAYNDTPSFEQIQKSRELPKEKVVDILIFVNVI